MSMLRTHTCITIHHKGLRVHALRSVQTPLPSIIARWVGVALLAYIKNPLPGQHWAVGWRCTTAVG